MAAQMQNTRVRQVSKVSILLGMGFYFVYMILSGSINNYINPQWAWLCWTGA